MVNSLLTSLLHILLVCLLLSLSSYAVAENLEPEIPLFKEHQGKVTVSVRPNKIILGQKITLTIKGENLRKSFNKIDWTQLEQHFVLYDTDIGFDRIKVQLYALESGSFKLDGQKAGLIALPDIQIEVAPNPEVSIEWSRPSNNLYIHQNAVWKALVMLKNIANRATYEQRSIQINRSVITHLEPLPVEAVEAEQGKIEILVASYEVKDWQGHTAKGVVLQSPVVTVKNTTNQRWYFFDSPLPVYLNPLPSFLPMSVAVGEVEWSSKPLNTWQITGDLNHWAWQLKGKGLTKAYLNSIAHQLVSQIPHNPNIEWLSDSREITTEFTNEGLQSVLNLRLPYRVTQAGLINFPQLQLHFFNPKTGMLISRVQAKTSLLAIPIWIIWLVQWVLLLSGLWISLLVMLSFKQAWLNRKLKREIKQSKDIHSLWSAMTKWRCQQIKGVKLEATKECPIDTQSTGQWAHWHKIQFGHSDEFENLVETLNQALYAPVQSTQQQHSDWLSIQQQALLWAETLPWRQSLQKMASRHKP
ncbi:MAG: hypothetical protein ISEC1_P0364 [Thiomicrorhabdus sp.]|nr:MAG: hypothetical protein ISEC1_P0364 [Thiomicrorhabdus sp.]